jgi:uncharacterized ferredoxin-like protein
MSKRDNLAAVAVTLITLVAKRLTQPISPANRFDFMKRQLEQLRNWGAVLLLGLTSTMLRLERQLPPAKEPKKVK